ncbi:MAG: outer membrane lipoprotein chaperone LolA [Burkholderiales bacterium]|nr:outer membrane lipoprotein chaperone LolA [Burkholderiales bacterium]
MSPRRHFLQALLGAGLAVGAGAARADAVDALRAFIRDVHSGRAAFTQTVTSVDGARKKVSSGEFEFQRPNRFRFEYLRPYEQLIVADGSQVWIYDPGLDQVSTRPLGQALGATPAALLAGGSLDEQFNLAAQPSSDGTDWVLATPKVKDGPFQSMRVGFKGGALTAVEIVDSFGQHSELRFSAFQANVALPPERFRFTPPDGADVIRP